MEDITKEELLEERLVYAEEAIETQSKLLADLTEYLVRTDPNFTIAAGSFDHWQSRLEGLRQEEREQREIHTAKRVLANAGYLVISDEKEIDMARVKKWVTSGHDPDDDIPF